MAELRNLPELARLAVESLVRNGKAPPLPVQGLDAFRQQQAGVFVTLKTGDRLRGCIGTIAPVTENVLVETVQNAVSAATRDPRFRPVQPSELDQLNYSVSVLHPPEQIFSVEALDPKRYGVIVASRGRRGLLLPDLEGIDTVQEQVRHAMAKGGIQPTEPVELYRFQVDKYEEEAG
ncbi:MAG: AMMECR1 domain-containing protein [Candidatus Melainabacteria bacterium HGW-Melainabacteria-1]|nr:MAG: AMMECR1 domain-containing protein [Candidatus Melainabacteria bacterium HGW-Melainabacteria-1]